jgi:hypothetical protein
MGGILGILVAWGRYLGSNEWCLGYHARYNVLIRRKQSVWLMTCFICLYKKRTTCTGSHEHAFAFVRHKQAFVHPVNAGQMQLNPVVWGAVRTLTRKRALRQWEGFHVCVAHRPYSGGGCMTLTIDN